MAQTAAFSGADVLLRGALAVAAASGSYAIARRGSGTETAASLRETETLAVSASRETETEAQLETTREQLDVQSARTDALERENAALAAALDRATRDAEAARGVASRASSEAATRAILTGGELRSDIRICVHVPEIWSDACDDHVHFGEDLHFEKHPLTAVRARVLMEIFLEGDLDQIYRIGPYLQQTIHSCIQSNLCRIFAR